MNRMITFGSLALLALAAVLLWSSAELGTQGIWEQSPLLLGIPAFAWLAGPWNLRDSAKPIPVAGLAVVCLLYVVGLMIGSIGISVLAWTGMAWIWMRVLMESGDWMKRMRLLPLLVFAFPWIPHDLPLLSELFQWSGAVIAEVVCQTLGLQTVRSGNNLIVEGMNMSVGPGCAGMTTLGMMLLCGSMLAGIMLVNDRAFWLYLPCMFVLAWFTNCLRIVFLVVTAAVTQSYETVEWVHDSEGYVALCLMFPLTMLMFRVIQVIGCRLGEKPGDTTADGNSSSDWATA